VLMDLLWSDPTTNDGVEGVQPSPRGPGLVTFGPDRVKDFCKVTSPPPLLPRGRHTQTVSGTVHQLLQPKKIPPPSNYHSCVRLWRSARLGFKKQRETLHGSLVKKKLYTADCMIGGLSPVHTSLHLYRPPLTQDLQTLCGIAALQYLLLPRDSERQHGLRRGFSLR